MRPSRVSLFVSPGSDGLCKVLRGLAEVGGTPGAALRRFLSPKSTPPVRPRLASYPAAPPHPVCLCFVFSVRLIFMSDSHNSAEPVSGALNWYLLMLCHVLAPAHVSSLGMFVSTASV